MRRIISSDTPNKYEILESFYALEEEEKGKSLENLFLMSVVPVCLSLVCWNFLKRVSAEIGAFLFALLIEGSSSIRWKAFPENTKGYRGPSRSNFHLSNVLAAPQIFPTHRQKVC